MHTMNKLKSAILSGVVAISALAAPLTTAVTPSLTATAAGAGDDYAKLLQYSLYFYDANMCGDQVGETSQLSWRDDCHTSDSVKGGFHDAGDHAKFGLPAGYSASVLDWSYYEFGDAFDSTGQTAHLKVITDYFAKYFRDSTTLSGGSVSNFVYQIGDGDADHAVWCAPEVQDSSSRKTFSTSSGASDIAASYAAALAAHYVNFGNADDLTYAKALFEFSTKYNKCATDGPNSFYESWDYYDKQAWAAGWLYLATKDNTYKTFLNTFMDANGQGKSGQAGCKWGVYSTLNWNNVSMGAAVLQAEITGSSSDWSKVTTYIDGHGANSSDYYFEMQWGSARYNAAQQFTALVASKHGAKDYNSWAKGQMDYIMGNKGVGSASATCFVVGLADNSAKYPHHRAASGYSSFDEMGSNAGYSSKGHVLVGALVGGPVNSGGSYTDSVQDYTANEVTLDYNAGLVGAAAGLYNKYQTGSVVATSSIPEVRATSQIVTTTTTNDPNVPTTTTTTVKTTTTTTTTVVTSKRVEEVSIASGQSEVQVKLNGADEIEFVVSANSGGSGNGAIDYTDTTGNYKQFGSYTYSMSSGGDYTVNESLSGISAQNDTVTLHIWWSDNSSVISKVNLIYYDVVDVKTTTTTTKTTTATTTTKVTTTTTVTPPGIVFGDSNCNGTIEMADAVLILQAIANPDKYGVNGSDNMRITAQGLINADCSEVGNGMTSKDALAVQKSLLKLITLPELEA